MIESVGGLRGSILPCSGCQQFEPAYFQLTKSLISFGYYHSDIYVAWRFLLVQTFQPVPQPKVNSFYIIFNFGIRQSQSWAEASSFTWMASNYTRKMVNKLKRLTMSYWKQKETIRVGPQLEEVRNSLQLLISEVVRNYSVFSDISGTSSTPLRTNNDLSILWHAPFCIFPFSKWKQ